jgi:hypothetical protein
MSTFGWIVIATGFLCALFLLVIALCAIAKDADELLDRHHEEQIAGVAHMCEYRHRRDTRNGLGRAS